LPGRHPAIAVGRGPGEFLVAWETEAGPDIALAGFRCP